MPEGLATSCSWDKAAQSSWLRGVGLRSPQPIWGVLSLAGQCFHAFNYIDVGLAAQSCLSLCDPMDYSPPEDRGQGFFRQEYWSGLPYPSPGDRPNPGIEPRSLALQADSLPSEPPGKPKNTKVGSLSLL